MIKRYCVKKNPTKTDIDIVDSLIVAVHGLLNSVCGVKAVCEYPESGVTFLYVFLLDKGSLAHEAMSLLMFLYSQGQREEAIDHWVDTYSKEHNDNMRMESLIAVFDKTNDPDYALSFIKVMNVFIDSHIGLFKRMNVGMAGTLERSSEAFL